MNPVADHLLNSLSGALSKGGPAAGASGADWGESPGRGPEAPPAPSRFAAVLERVQGPASAANPAANPVANPAARRAAAASQSAPGPVQAPAAERRRGEPVSDRGVDAAARDEAAEEAAEDAAEDRQEIATGLSAQWAALVRGEGAERRTSAADEGAADGINEGGTGGSTIDFMPPRDGGIAAAAPDGDALLEAAAATSAVAAAGADGQALLADGSASSTPPNQQATLQSGLADGFHKEARRTGAFAQARGPVQAALSDAASLSSRGGLRTAEVGGIALAHDTSTSTQPGPSTADGTPAAAVGPTDAAGAPLLPLPTLVAWQLSPQLAVITAPQPAASDESLRAFAAAQGFDAQALHRMFGGDSGVAASPEASPGLPSGMADPSALAAWAAGAPGWWARSTNPSGLETSGATAASSAGSGLVAVAPGDEAVVDLSGAAGVGQADAVAAGLS
ncbi:MAG: hypothetical protein KGP02_12590, partial [Burkholderiales bacterium]|nr:hypothetical protein [Burkholderiales bacterium]